MTLIEDSKADFIQGPTTWGFVRTEIGLNSRHNEERSESIAKLQSGSQWMENC